MIVIRNTQVILSAQQVDTVKQVARDARRKGEPLVVGADWDVQVYPERAWRRPRGHAPRWVRRAVAVVR